MQNFVDEQKKSPTTRSRAGKRRLRQTMATRTSYKTTETLNGNQKWADRWIREHSFSHIYKRGLQDSDLLLLLGCWRKYKQSDRQKDSHRQIVSRIAMENWQELKCNPSGIFAPHNTVGELVNLETIGRIFHIVNIKTGLDYTSGESLLRY